MAMHCPKYETILLIADSEKNKKWTLELLLLKCDFHFSFLYKKGLVICTKNKKEVIFLGGPVIGTLRN